MAEDHQPDWEKWALIPIGSHIQRQINQTPSPSRVDYMGRMRNLCLVCDLVLPWHSLPRAWRNWRHQHWLKHGQRKAFARGADKTIWSLPHFGAVQNWEIIWLGETSFNGLIAKPLFILQHVSSNLRLVAAEGHAPPRLTSSKLWIGRRFSENANFIFGFEPSSGLEVILLSHIQKSIKDTLNNVLDEQLDGSLVPESENQTQRPPETCWSEDRQWCQMMSERAPCPQEPCSRQRVPIS